MVSQIVNNQIKWYVRDTLKEALAKRVREGLPREKVIVEFEEGYENSMEEMKQAVGFLIEDEHLEKTENENIFIITEGYFNHLKGK